ncbi:MAG TPA: hypothetical protein VMF09_13895 [Solirubrobacteraceae bacterium]|nr:hypothetical protein [Solirubrobacteraceae bacterium]
MHRLSASLCLALCALTLAACGASSSSTSTSGFSGTKREVARTIANFQSHATSSEEKKICSEDLAASVVSRLGGTSGCEAAIKHQLSQIDNLEVGIESVDLADSGKSATAHVRSIREGKTKPSTLSLVKEAGKWRISGT